MKFRRRNQEVDEEIRSHLEMAIADRIANGEEPKTARANALRELGNRTLVEEASHDVWALQTWAEGLWQDLRYACRGLLQSPGFTAVAILSLAIGIGGNAAIFSLLYEVMLRPLPVRDAGRLVELLQEYPNEPRGNYWDDASYLRIQSQNRFLDRMTGLSVDNRARWTVAGRAPEITVSESVAGNYFDALGVPMIAGRAIADSDIGQQVTVLSARLSNDAFQSAANAIGKQIIIHNKPFTVVGVAAPSYTGLRVEAKTGLWIPRQDTRGPIAILGWLKPDVTIEQAEADLKVLHHQTLEERVARTGDALVWKIKPSIAKAGTGLNTVRDRLAKPLSALLALTALVLLLACVNIATMLLARGAAREREMSLRTSLGATRWRLVRQVLTECLLLSCLGTLAGVFVAYGSTRLLTALLASGRLHEQVYLDVRPDARTVSILALTALLAAIVFALVPTWNILRGTIAAGLRSNQRTARTLVAIQVALSVVLLASAALFVGHLRDLQHIDLGFERENVLLVSLETARSGYTPDQLAGAYRRILDSAAQVPGIATVSMGAPTPLSGAGASGYATVEGFAERAEDRRRVSMSWIAPGYFATIGTPLLSGRDFTYQEPGDGMVAIINETLARHYFPGGQNPIGKSITMDRVTLATGTQMYRIIGVAADSNYLELREPVRRAMYLPAFRADGPIAGASLFVRTRGIRPEAVTGAVREAIRQAAPRINVSRVITLDDQVNATMMRERIVAALSGFFGIAGALLAGLGLYGLLAYSVARRTGEIGVRMALGASPGDVARMIGADAFRMVAAGLAMGLLFAWWSGRFATAVVPGLSANTIAAVAPVLAGTAAAVVIIGFVSAYVPARRASKVDPMLAVRHE